MQWTVACLFFFAVDEVAIVSKEGHISLYHFHLIVFDGLEKYLLPRHGRSWEYLIEEHIVGTKTFVTRQWLNINLEL